MHAYHMIWQAYKHTSDLGSFSRVMQNIVVHKICKAKREFTIVDYKTNNISKQFTKVDVPYYSCVCQPFSMCTLYMRTSILSVLNGPKKGGVLVLKNNNWQPPNSSLYTWIVSLPIPLHHDKVLDYYYVHISYLWFDYPNIVKIAYGFKDGYPTTNLSMHVPIVTHGYIIIYRIVKTRFHIPHGYYHKWKSSSTCLFLSAPILQLLVDEAQKIKTYCPHYWYLSNLIEDKNFEGDD